MVLPFIPLLKLIALGSIKIIFLLLGLVFFPVFALQFILGGATTMLLPTLNWLEENGRLEATRHRAIVSDLEELSNMGFTRKESRYLLWKLIIKMMNNAVVSIRNGFDKVRQTVQKLIG